MTPTTRALSELPKSIRLGACDVSITVCAPIVVDGSDSWGSYDSAERLIKMSSELQTPRHVVEIFIHEMTHAIFHQNYLCGDSDEERVVTLTARSWTQLYRDHSWLARWIGKWSK